MNRKPFAANDVLVSVAVLAVAYALKRHYSTATADELRWILAPTALVAGAPWGGAFTNETGVGYVSPRLSTIIVPACAGVNFLIIAFSMLGIAFVGKMRSARAKWAWFVASAALAYLSAILVNGTRIAVGVALREHAASLGSLSPAMVHRAEGTVVYLSALWALFAVVEGALARGPARSGRAA